MEEEQVTERLVLWAFQGEAMTSQAIPYCGVARGADWLQPRSGVEGGQGPH